jgi:hypothetical protein
MALQLRHGKAKENSDILKQTFKTKKGKDLLPLPLLVVHCNQAVREEGERQLKNMEPSEKCSADQLKVLPSRVVFVDALAMSSTAWLQLVSPPGA